MELSRMPFVLKRNRVAYLIKGGTLLKEFFGYDDPDNRYSQVWLASTVTSSLRKGTEGLSVLREDFGGGYLKELLEREPEAFLGKKHADVYGASPAVLVKLLNSETRLLVQTHPTKENAKRYFGLPFGKTECWYVLAVEKNRPAYIYAGFRPGVTRECFRSYIEAQDREKILNCLHRFAVVPGDVVYIPAGTPHALGAGSLVAEIQEPVDITLRAERIRPDGSVLPEESLHGGKGMEVLLDCFDFTCMERERARERFFVKTLPLNPDGDAGAVRLIGPGTTECFTMNRICLSDGGGYNAENPSFVIAFITGGSGELLTGDQSLKLERGMEVFIPHGVSQYRYRTEQALEVLECFPPE